VLLLQQPTIDKMIESNGKKQKLRDFMDMNEELFVKLSNVTENFVTIFMAVKKVMRMSAVERLDLYQSLSTNMDHQNSTDEKLQLIVLEYIYSA
jgi:hypothetical protein